jgi:hypothetical protein
MELRDVFEDALPQLILFSFLVLMRNRIFFLVLLLGLAACSERPTNNPATSSEPSTAITADEAVAIVSELPEAKAWSKYLNDSTGGKVQAAMTVEPEHPETIEGKQYWSVNYYENQPTHFHRWQTFMVRLDGKEILVDDVTTGEYRSLEEWREKEKPMERVNKTKAPP